MKDKLKILKLEQIINKELYDSGYISFEEYQYANRELLKKIMNRS